MSWGLSLRQSGLPQFRLKLNKVTHLALGTTHSWASDLLAFPRKVKPGVFSSSVWTGLRVPLHVPLTLQLLPSPRASFDSSQPQLIKWSSYMKPLVHNFVKQLSRAPKAVLTYCLSWARYVGVEAFLIHEQSIRASVQHCCRSGFAGTLQNLNFLYRSSRCRCAKEHVHRGALTVSKLQLGAWTAKRCEKSYCMILVIDINKLLSYFTNYLPIGVLGAIHKKCLR